MYAKAEQLLSLIIDTFSFISGIFDQVVLTSSNVYLTGTFDRCPRRPMAMYLLR